MLRSILNKICYATPIGVTLLMAAALLLTTSGSAQATPLPINPAVNCQSSPPPLGSGCLNGGSYSVQVLANSCVNFYNGAGAPDVCPPGSGATFTNLAPIDTNLFTFNATSTTKDLIFGGGVVPSFMTVPGPLGTVTFDLISVVSSNAPACLSSPACSVGIFTLTQQDLNGNNCPVGASPCGRVEVGFGFNAVACLNGSTVTGCSASGGSTPYVINYTSPFVNETIADLIAKSQTPSGVVDSVSFVASPAAVPEPAGFMLMGGGLLAISLLSRRLRKQA